MQFTLSQVLAILATGGGAVVAIISWLFKRYQKSLDDGFTEIKQTLKEHNADARALERRLATLEADLPKTYVMRSDLDARIQKIEDSIDKIYALLINRAA